MFERLINFKNSKEWILFEDYYNKSNFLNQLNFFRFEDLHTNYISSLLNENNVYGLSDFPLRLLIELIACKSDDAFNKQELINNYSISDINVETQKSLKVGRLDMFIQFKLNNDPYLILFEDKLFSSEGQNQCKKYSDEINNDKQYERTKKVFVYLSLDCDIDISDNNFIKISFQELVEKVLIPCSIKENDKNLTLSINEYIKGFVSLYEQDYINYKSIPITNEGKNLTKEIWEHHNSLLKDLLCDDKYFEDFYRNHKNTLRILFINLLKLDIQDEINETLINKINDRINKIKKRNILDNKIYNNTDFVYEIFKDIIINKNIKSINDLSPLNTLAGQGWKAIISESEMENESKKDAYRLYKNKTSKETLTINDERYYYCVRNTGQETEIFISAVINKYPEYKERIKRI